MTETVWRSIGILHAVRHVSGCHDARGQIAVAALIVEEDVGTEILEEGGFVFSGEKNRFVDTDTPTA